MAEKDKRSGAAPGETEPVASVPADDASSEDAEAAVPAGPETDGPRGIDSDEASEPGTDDVADAAELSVEERLRRERDDFEDRWLRSVAELDNYRKRSLRELADTRRFAVADLMRAMLELLDNFERALPSLSEAETRNQELEAFRAGVELIYRRCREIMTEHGLQPIEATGQPFDPRLHEAMQEIEKEGASSGEVVEVIQTGYKLHDLVLRPSRVIIAK